MIHSQEIHTEIKLSRSVVDALNNLRPEPKPSAIEIIREIIKIHEELAKKEGKELINKVILDATSEEPSVDPITVSVTLGQRKEVGEWIKELSSLYVKERDKVPQLHVRLFIIGLCLTDLNTGIKLRANKFFEKIRDDVKETIYPNLLTEKGRKLWRNLFNIYQDKVSTHKDAPASIDQLGRKPFAKFSRSEIMWQRRMHSYFILMEQGDPERAHFFIRKALEEKAQKEKSQKSSHYSIHYSIRDALKKYRKEKQTQWIIVEFNAWQNQRTGPPWSSLMDTVYTQSKSYC